MRVGERSCPTRSSNPLKTGSCKPYGRGDAKRAEWEKARQRSRWDHWGVALPSMDAAIKQPLGDLT
jgi:hypothetical protein